VGFQSHHLFESGSFGENIDVLSGNLSLTIPIGPQFQVNDRLNFQLRLSSNLEMWNYGEWDASMRDPTVNTAERRNTVRPRTGVFHTIRTGLRKG